MHLFCNWSHVWWLSLRSATIKWEFGGSLNTRSHWQTEILWNLILIRGGLIQNSWTHEPKLKSSFSLKIWIMVHYDFWLMSLESSFWLVAWPPPQLHSKTPFAVNAGATLYIYIVTLSFRRYRTGAVSLRPFSQVTLIREREHYICDDCTWTLSFLFPEKDVFWG